MQWNQIIYVNRGYYLLKKKQEDTQHAQNKNRLHAASPGHVIKKTTGQAPRFLRGNVTRQLKV
jgi:hypothetical protein